MATWEDYIEGPRWAKFGDGLQKFAIEARSKGWDITVDYVRVSKGLIRETTFFKVSGPDLDLEYFQKKVLKAIREWNR